MIIDTTEAARRLGLSRTRIVQLLNEGRILNASKFGGQRGIWVIEVEGNAAPVIIGSNGRHKCQT